MFLRWDRFELVSSYSARLSLDYEEGERVADSGENGDRTDKIRAEDLHSHFSEGVELFFDSSVFLVLGKFAFTVRVPRPVILIAILGRPAGTILPWDTWIDANFLPLPRLILLAVAILLLKRIPIVLLLYKLIPQVKTFKEVRSMLTCSPPESWQTR